MEIVSSYSIIFLALFLLTNFLLIPFSHEPLEVTPGPNQWKYFDMAEEAATDE